MQSDIESVELHDVLSNKRRQLVLKFLRDHDGQLSARDLADYIAEVETDESPPPANIRRSVYISLHQTHLPKLDELDIVEYDQSAKMVHLSHKGEQVSIYMETVPKYGISWSEYYLGISAMGLLLIISGEIGVPVLASIGSLTLATVTIVVLLASTVYQTITQRSSVIHRLRE